MLGLELGLGIGLRLGLVGGVAQWLRPPVLPACFPYPALD